MTPAKIALLADRGVVRVTGADAEKLLQGIITNDMDLLAVAAGHPRRAAHPAGQDPVRVLRGESRRRLPARDRRATRPPTWPSGSASTSCAPRSTIAGCQRRLSRAGAVGRCSPHSSWRDRPAPYRSPTRGLPALGSRILAEARSARGIAAATNGMDAAPEDYHAHRIALGVPEGGKDYALGDAFPHEADLDQLGGVSFSKGCFVGQEVVSRMQNRANVRKRVVPIEGEATARLGRRDQGRRGRHRHGRLGRGPAGAGAAAARSGRGGQGQGPGR